MKAQKISPKLKEKYKNIDISIHENGDEISLSKIVVPKEKRGAGIGTKIMKDLIDYSDRTGQRIVLTPSNDFGGSVPRLKDFYKRFGFTENKGRGRDFSTKESFIRPSKNKVNLTDIWNKANKTDSSPLEAEAKKFKSAEEFVKKEAIRKQLIEDGTMINADDTVTLYHATLPERLEKIKKQGFVRGGAEATGGMTGLDLQPSAFFGTDKRWVEETWGGKARHVLEVKVPLEHIRKPAQNTLEVYFEGGLKRQGDIWVPAQPVRSTFYDRIAEKGLINKQQLTDIWNKANKTDSSPLEVEAKKFKSAEEFVESHDVFHGTPADIKGGSLKFGEGDQLKKGGHMGGHFLTNDPEIASAFSFGGEVYRASGDIKRQVLDVNKNKKLFKDFIGSEYKIDGESVVFTKQEFDTIFPNGRADWSTINQELAEQLSRAEGKIGVALPEFAAGKEGITYQIFKDEIPIHTKQQLTDIWNKANNK